MCSEPVRDARCADVFTPFKERVERESKPRPPLAAPGKGALGALPADVGAPGEVRTKLAT
jgi:hypothetical protein